jgi:hypothetical protein
MSARRAIARTLGVTVLGVATVAVVAGLLLVAAAGAADLSNGDKQLAAALVVTKGDVDYGFPDGAWTAQQCLASNGFAITARASSPAIGTPHTLIDSLATVLKTKAEAKRYYHAAVRKMSGCLARHWRHSSGSPFVGPARPLGFPHHGDQSAARRLPRTYASASAGDGFKSYTDDWIVIRKGRAVLADYFNYWLGWTVKRLTSAQEEQLVARRQLARAFGG